MTTIYLVLAICFFVGMIFTGIMWFRSEKKRLDGSFEFVELAIKYKRLKIAHDILFHDAGIKKGKG